MRRWMHILTLVVFIAPMSGLGALWSTDACSDECAGEIAAAETCTSDCGQCACCPGGRLLPAAPTAAAAPHDRGQAVLATTTGAPGAPDPREILHVPRLSFA
jgi:hypothetical protein